jgi:hypothetical protein
MSEMVMAPIRRVTPVMATVMALALAAAVLLGFGLRTWTEHTPEAAPPRVVRVHVPAAPTTPTNPAFQCRIGRAC